VKVTPASWKISAGEIVHETNPIMTIGAFARSSRLSVKALRLYESHGILRPESVDELNGYRRYRQSQLLDARLVRMLRRLDMPLADVARVLAEPRAVRASQVERYWAAQLERVRAQDRLASLLQEVLSGGKERYPMYTINTRDVAEQTVLTEQRNVTVAELTSWIAEAGGRQHAALAAHGGPIGPAIIIYHGDVNEDSDGPVEVCSPVSAEVATSLAVPYRQEPAHREAFTRITKAQVRYPDILSAYDAVESWAAEHGEQVTGAPREVYFADFMDAADGDEVCDVAYPIAMH
jgi:DNA-binding transcriptional MerR regulator